MSRRQVFFVALLLGIAFVGGRLYERATGPSPRSTLAESRDDVRRERMDAAVRRTEAGAARRLRADVAALAPQRPGHPDLFVLGIAGDGTEQVFLNEVRHLRELAERRLDARGHVLVLANHAVEPPAETPVAATPDTIRAALAGIGATMDPDEDVLLLYATTHGSEDHWLLLRRDDGPDRLFDGKQLRAALDDAGIRHRVLALSACYSGGLAPKLLTADTLFLAAARSDRPSFGCGNDSAATFFGRAWLVDGLNSTVDFAEAFLRARAAIGMREAAGDYEPSRPQIRQGARIGATLATWREGFTPGPPVPYPYEEIVDEIDEIEVVDDFHEFDNAKGAKPSAPPARRPEGDS